MEDSLQKLEDSVDQLIKTCRRLRGENAALRESYRKLSREHAERAEKTRAARRQLESTLARLRGAQPAVKPWAG